MEKVNTLMQKLNSVKEKEETINERLKSLMDEKEEIEKQLNEAKNYIEELKIVLNECINTVTLFVQRYSKIHLASSFKVSGFMRVPIVEKLNEIIGAGKQIHDFLKFIIIEFEALKKPNASEAIKQLNSRLDSLELKKDSKDIPINKKLELEIDLYHRREKQLAEENTSLKLSNENMKKTIGRLEVKLREIVNQQERTELEMKHKMISSMQSNNQFKELQDKVDLLKNERQDLEVLLKKISNAMPTIEMQKSITEFIKTQLELHALMRERSCLVRDLGNDEATLRLTIANPSVGMKVRKNVEELRTQLLEYEERIELGNKVLSKFEDELVVLGRKVFAERQGILNKRTYIGDPKINTIKSSILS